MTVIIKSSDSDINSSYVSKGKRELSGELNPSSSSSAEKLSAVTQVSNQIVTQAEKISQLLESSIKGFSSESKHPSHGSLLSEKKIGPLSALDSERLSEMIAPHIEDWTKEAALNLNGAVYKNQIDGKKLVRPIIVTRKGEIHIVFKKHQPKNPDDASKALDELIGQGGKKMVWADYSSDGTSGVFARPKYTTDSQGAANSETVREFNFLKRFSHNEVYLVEYQNAQGKTRVGIHMPKFDCDLETFFSDSNSMKLPITSKVAIFKEICLILKKAHDQGVLHNDLKLENVFMKDGHVSLQDWGFAREEQDTRYLRAGSLDLMAPEKHLRNDVGIPSDIWSLGLMFYNILLTDDSNSNYSGQPLRQFIYLMAMNDDNDVDVEFLKRCMGKFNSDWAEGFLPKDLSQIPQEFSTLMKAMVNPDPSLRPTIDDVIDCLDAWEKKQ